MMKKNRVYCVSCGYFDESDHLCKTKNYPTSGQTVRPLEESEYLRSYEILNILLGLAYRVEMLEKTIEEWRGDDK